MQANRSTQLQSAGTLAVLYFKIKDIRADLDAVSKPDSADAVIRIAGRKDAYDDVLDIIEQNIIEVGYHIDG